MVTLITLLVQVVWSLHGSGALETIVECDPGAGLYMSSLHEVTIRFITFNGCGFRNELAEIF